MQIMAEMLSSYSLELYTFIMSYFESIEKYKNGMSKVYFVPRVKEVPSNKLQFEIIKTFSHYNIKKLDILLVRFI